MTMTEIRRIEMEIVISIIISEFLEIVFYEA